jgi:hypothetical protein
VYVSIGLAHPATHLMLHSMFELHESLANAPEARPQMVHGLAGALPALAREALKQSLHVLNHHTEIPQSLLHCALPVCCGDFMMVVIPHKRHRYFPESSFQCPQEIEENSALI